MKKIISTLFCALLLGMGAFAQAVTVTLAENSWDGGSNLQGFAAITPDKTILKGDKVTITATGTFSLETTTEVGVIIIDTVPDDFGESQWLEVTSWGKTASITEGVVSVDLSFTAAKDVTCPVICFYHDTDEDLKDAEININVTCTAVTPEAPQPGDLFEVNLDEAFLIWGEDVSYDKETHVASLNAWNSAVGWAYWDWSLTSGNALLPSEEYESFTVEFEPVTCQVQLVLQGEDGTEEGTNYTKVVEPGESSVTLNIVEEFMDAQDIRGMWIQLGDATTITLTKAYFTYKSEETAVADVATPVQIENGIVYSEGVIKVYNVAGQKVAEANKTFNLQSLPKGLYLVSAQEGITKYNK